MTKILESTNQTLIHNGGRLKSLPERVVDKDGTGGGEREEGVLRTVLEVIVGRV